ncbi:MAG: phage virion morphogenesis protein [Betaproteobacteria bacterium]|nr:phage virion morphogenesis protein [Betaproteobacteria bacterium]
MFTITIEADAVQRALQGIEYRARNLQPALRAIAGLLEDRTAQNFADQSGPLGKWPALKNPPRNKKRTSPKILVDTARLKNSIASRVTAQSVQVGTNVVYAAIHQLGGTIDIAARSQQAYFKQGKDGSVGNRFVKKSRSNFAQWHTRGAHQINMPACPYLPFIGNRLQNGVEESIVEVLNSYLAGKYQR